MNTSPLNEAAFKALVENAPLVAIDLLIERGGKFLVGARKNRPAKGFLFVPGGRIHKGESITRALERISAQEIGIKLAIDRAEALGVTEHLYDESMFDEKTPTHYVVLPYKVAISEEETIRCDNQHSEMKWLSSQEILGNPNTHPNTRRYFCSVAAHAKPK